MGCRPASAQMPESATKFDDAFPCFFPQYRGDSVVFRPCLPDGAPAIHFPTSCAGAPGLFLFIARIFMQLCVNAASLCALIRITCRRDSANMIGSGAK